MPDAALGLWRGAARHAVKNDHSKGDAPAPPGQSVEATISTRDNRRAPGRGALRKSTTSASSDRALAPQPLEETLALALHSLRFSATLADAVLTYRLTVTNGGKTALGPVCIAADMIAADPHAPSAPLLEQHAAQLPELHILPVLAPGQTAHLQGELRRPLRTIAPLRVGGAALMVPLIRLKVAAGPLPGAAKAGRRLGKTRNPAEQMEPLCRLAQVVIGEPDADGSDSLHPFRLDLGPCNWPAVARWVPDMAA